MVECDICHGAGRLGLFGCPVFACFAKPCAACSGRGTLARATDAAASAGARVPGAGTAGAKGGGKGKGKGTWQPVRQTPPPLPGAPSTPRSAAAKAKARSESPAKAEMRKFEPLQVARLFTEACARGDVAACGRLLADDIVSRQSLNKIETEKALVNVADGPLYKLFRTATIIRDWEEMEDATYVLRELDEEWFMPPRGLGHCKGFDDFHQKSQPKALTAAVCSETGGLLIGTAWGLATARDAVVAAKKSLQAVERGELKAMIGSTSVMWPPEFQSGLLAATNGGKIVSQTLFIERRGKKVPLSRQLLIKDGLITRIMWWYTGHGSEITFRVPTPKLDPSLPLVIPEYWDNKDKKGAFHETISSKYVTEVADKLLTGTFRNVSTRDRFGQPVPKRLNVLSAFRVEDAALWQRYDVKRKEIRDQCGKRAKRSPVKTDAQLPKRITEGLDAQAGEAYLFHGTSPDAAMGITKTGFCIDLAGAAIGTAFGKGAYFAECSSKSDEYAKAREVSRIYETAQAMEQALAKAKGSVFAIILCRVALGRVLSITEFDQQGHLRVLGSETVHTASACKYDSLLGDREAVVGTYREYVVYHPAQVYPEYVILYEREY